MTRHSACRLASAALALLATAVACKGPVLSPSRPTLSELEAACAPVRQEVRAEIDADSACTADWECRELLPEYLGCDAWANRGFRVGDDGMIDLEGACAPISFVPDCGERVGACVAKKCTGRKRVVNAAACREAKAALQARLSAATSCSTDAGCATVMTRGLRGAGPSDWAECYAGELAASQEACTPGDDGRLPVPACVAERCTLQPGDEVVRPPVAPITKPHFVQRNCVGSALRLPSGLAGVPWSVTVTFRVSTRGVPQAFGFQGTTRRDLMNSLAEAISSCALIPAMQGDKPVEVWMVLPIQGRS